MKLRILIPVDSELVGAAHADGLSREDVDDRRSGDADGIAVVAAHREKREILFERILGLRGIRRGARFRRREKGLPDECGCAAHGNRLSKKKPELLETCLFSLWRYHGGLEKIWLLRKGEKR